MGSAAAIQALKLFSSGGDTDEETKAPSQGKVQSQKQSAFLAIAMSEASKVSRSSSSKPPGTNPERPNPERPMADPNL